MAQDPLFVIHVKCIFIQKTVLFQLIQFSMSIFWFTQLKVKTVLFQTIQFSIGTQFQSQKQFYFISNNSV